MLRCLSVLKDRVAAVGDWLVLGSSVAIIILVIAYLRQGESLRHANRAIAGFGIAVVQQNVDARYDDCQALNKLRAGLRAQVQRSQATVPVLFHLVPALNTPVVRQLEQASGAREMKLFAPADCAVYARRAIPHGDSHRYRVP